MVKKKKIRYKQPSTGLSEMVSPKPISSTRASIGMENMLGDVYSIKIENLIPFKNQARRVFVQEEIDAMALTIKEYGIRQPLTVVKDVDNEDKYQVVSGERRLRAAIQAGLSRVPCVVLPNLQKAEEIAIIENLHRSDLHPIEAAIAYNKLLETGQYLTQQEIADRLSLKKSAVSEHLKLIKLPQDIQDFLLKNNIRSREILRKLLSFESIDKMKSFLKMTDSSSNQEKNKDINSISILRISLSEGQYKIQKKAMRLLSEEQKASLKNQLLEIISQLD